ncbi:MAG: BMC domain-containing protein [Ignavibacterium sp.]|uniref:BMC domain-containing protein n=1 Tax=Ignavibacterium sp. TaxID=2651167 RepID=UPI00404A1E54
MMNSSLALIEVNGFCATISAVDTLLKNSSVEIELKEMKNGNVLLKLKGSFPQIKYSLNLAIETINKISSVTNFTVLENLNPSIEKEFFNKTNQLRKESITPKIKSEEKLITPKKEELPEKKSESVKVRKVKKTAAKELSNPKEEIHSSEISDVNLNTIERLQLETLSKKIATEKKTEANKPKVVSSYIVKKLSDLDGLNVHKLRRVARDFEEFPIKGRQISIANRDELMVYFKQILPE